jgi:hypothetical protein
MAGNPLIAQGALNRLRASIVWTQAAELNVTAGYLGRQGIRLTLDGESSTYIPTLTGAVTSPEAYMMMTCTIHLLKTQQLAGLYKLRMETTSLLGDGVLRPDSEGLPPYQLTNCSIQSVRDLSFSGDEADFAVAIRGYYLINALLWNF